MAFTFSTPVDEPNPVLRLSQRERLHLLPAHVAAITRTLGKLGHDQATTFATPKWRDTCLWAARKHLDPITTYDQLFVRFGKRRGPASNAEASVEFV